MKGSLRKWLYRLHSFLVSKVVTRVFELAYSSFPPIVHVETTNACNGNCVMCPRSRMTRRIGFMDEELYRTIVNQCAPNKIRCLHLHNFGEPLLDRHLANRIKLAKEAGISRVKIFTNGSLLTKEKSEELIQSGLDEIKISVDGSNKEVFESTRKNLDYEGIYRNIQHFLDLRRGSGNSKPRIELVYTTLEKNPGEMVNFRQKWEGKVDNIHIDIAHNWAGNIRLAEYFEDNASNIRHPCLRIWNTFTILWNGEVALCCLDYDGRKILGNVRHQTIREIWQSSKLREIRKMHEARKLKEAKICGDCSKTMYVSRG